MTPKRGLKLYYAQPPNRLHLKEYTSQDLGRTDIHRLGIPHEEKLGGIVWVHVLHYHVRPPSALVNAVSAHLYRCGLTQDSQKLAHSMRSYTTHVHQELRTQLAG